MSFATLLFGPLTAVETRRLTARPWMFWARMGSGLIGVAILATVAFVLWVSAQAQIDRPPGTMLRGSLFLTSLCTMLAALLVSPALLAGSLAGEKDQGTLGMLLIARLASWEIIAGRLLPRLAQVAFLTLGVAMPLAYLAGLNNLGLVRFLVLAGLIASVAFGAGGLALAISTLVRRGRDALMALFGIYAAALVVLTAGPRMLPSPAWDYLAVVNPFAALGALCLDYRLGPALAVSALWLAMGSCAALLGAWQLRPAYVRQLGGAVGRRRARRMARLRAIGNRPMLWKELFVERTAALGWIGQWLSGLLTGLLLAGSLGSAAVIVCVELLGLGPAYAAEFARWILREIVDNTAVPLSWLVQWAIGLRAAVSISSERQRHTWDSLLTSPLEGVQIILGKFGGSLYALRWLLAAVFVSWIVAVSCGEMGVGRLLYLLMTLLMGAALIAAVGVQISLLNTGAARSMAYTLGIWLAAALGSAVAASLLALFLCLFGYLGLIVIGYLLFGLGVTDDPQPPSIPHVTFGLAYGATFLVVRASIYLTAAAMIVGWLSRSFDRLAGRGWPRDPPDKPFWVTARGELLSSSAESR